MSVHVKRMRFADAIERYCILENQVDQLITTDGIDDIERQVLPYAVVNVEEQRLADMRETHFVHGAVVGHPTNTFAVGCVSLMIVEEDLLIGLET